MKDRNTFNPRKSYAQDMPPWEKNGKTEELEIKPATSSLFVEQKIDHYEPDWFQVEDLAHLYGRSWSANWSEMGCYKTSTLLWLIKERTKDIKNPKVLIITTRTGKGTYFKLAPHLLPDWTLLNIMTRRVNLVINDFEIKQDFPEQINFPTLFVTHYAVFSDRKKKKKKGEEQEDLDQEELLEQVIKEFGTKKQFQRLLEIDWDFIALDEAHAIKGRGTGWTKNILKLKRRKTQTRHIMTGTGFINKPDEIWQPLNFLNHRVFSSYWKFRERYALEEEDWSGYRRVVGVNPEHKDEFRNLVRTVGPRRTKAEVFKDLPHPIFSPKEVELSPTQRRVYDDLVAYLESLDQKGTPIYAPNVLSALQRCRQVCVATPEVAEDYYDEELEKRIQKIRLVEPSSKLDAVMEILAGLEWDEERRDQVVVFSQFKDPLELLKKRLEPQYDSKGRLRREGIPYIHLEEKDNDRVRYEKWQVQFPKKEHQVFMSTLQLGSESIDLTPATTCIFLDRSWSPLHNEQGVSRVWRPGQEHVANIIHINAADTTDQRVLDTNNMKVSWFQQIFGDETTDDS